MGVEIPVPLWRRRLQNVVVSGYGRQVVWSPAWAGAVNVFFVVFVCLFIIIITFDLCFLFLFLLLCGTL